ncbi:MAG TPA: GntR family transcriptional regulator, partial [Reyranella sp.]|nr:GntR family transcriptional regulator [Reyranella sp.]
MTIVDRDLGAPLHHQIYLVLADGIAAGRYAAGELLPTEEQLGKLFSVSRITVRRAMASLQNAGLIERGAGRRTVVKPLGKPLKMPMASVISNIAAYGAQ